MSNGIIKNEAEFFDKIALSGEDAWWGGKTVAGKERMRRRAKLAAIWVSGIKNPTILEIGCGIGSFSEPFIEEVNSAKLVCSDISEESIKLASRLNKNNVEFKVLNVLKTGYPTETFDAVIGKSILHHLPIEDALREIFRILKSGGVIWFSEPNMLNPIVFVIKKIKPIGMRLQETQTETAFYPAEIELYFRQAGFINVNVRPFDFVCPITPKWLLGFNKVAGHMFETIPVLKYLAGSLMITAEKPKETFEWN